MIFGGKVALAQNTLPSVKNDYIPCDVQPCVTIAGSEWSEKNPNGVAVAVRMGVKPAVTDAEIKMVLTHDLKKHGVNNIKFFYEQNDAPASGIFLHVRDGLEGPFLIDTVREQIPFIARRALNTNPLFRVD
ncbi:MAG: hypothetical protein K0U40_08585 [Betaproteobacteria bacterium]|nr:hypothetical protein [Betaproteobacteria bacterium]